MTTRLNALLAAAALALAGCKGKSVDEFCAARFDALKAWGVRCGTSRDVAAASWDPYRDYLCAGVVQLEKDQKVSYDSGLADQCLKRLESLECGPLLRVVDDPCDLAIRGTVEAGGQCFTGVECAPDTLCAASDCPGVCVARAAVGFECGGLVRCQDGAYCLSGSCVASVAEGGACRVGSLDCADNLYCAGAKPIQASPPGACKKVGAQPGGSCDQPEACVWGSVCAGQDPATNTAGTCQAPVADGGACTVSSSCAPESSCLNGQCSPRPRLGEACGRVGGGSAACLVGWCRMDAGAGTCTVFLSPGEVCDTADACGPVARCQAGKCVAFCAEPGKD